MKGIMNHKKLLDSIQLAITFLTLLCLLLLMTGAIQAQENSQELDAVVERALQQHNVPGAAVAVVEDGALSWAKGYGMAEPAQNLPVMPDTVFDSASVTKPVTAWGIMKLVEAGLLDLDVPITNYVTRWELPSSEYDHDMVTIRRVLSHTAGLSTDGDTGVIPGEYVPTLIEAMNGAILGTDALHVAYPPATGYHYASNGYTLLEMAIEEVTDEPFAVYMQREILDPLGMVDSGFDWTPELSAKAAVGHDWYNNPLPYYQFSTKAQGGLLTTAPDLAIFMAAHMPGPNGEPIGRDVISPEAVAEILTAVPFANEAESPHVTGLGFDLIMANGNLLGARKTGDHRGWKPIIVMDLEDSAGIAIMANSDRAMIGFLIDIVCAWNESVDGHLMAADCQALHMIRNVQLGLGGVLALVAFIFIGWTANGLRTGKRHLNWEMAPGKIVRLVVFSVILIAWWVLWHTDVLFFRILNDLPETAVTIRYLVPWPTAFVWISRGLTLLMLTGIVLTFIPPIRVYEATNNKAPRQP